ncbi:TPA: bifunctional phosphopantothenoylcysteine decarboxylase/phosphopantothenate--cysteine ligase CoaBC [Candidatus Sumerlaeota bacterium]|nr:bifunctional phosphopantothenoylcysteine decarboxylase/phosphopantothenate--cysteine ligase CoaBC [Candidatus Sumerlaeota bacterium]
MFKNAHILLGVTGGIAAFKAVELCRRFQKAGAKVRVIMTQAACEFITPLTFETLTHQSVYTDVFDKARAFEIEHVSFAQWGDILVIAPATANMIAKMAAGLADDPLSTTVLAFRGPVVVAPAMNTAMWDNAKTRENLEALRGRGVRLVAPDVGMLACGDEGAGRLANLSDIVQAVTEELEAARQAGPLASKKILITAGPTIEKIDPVRFISNPSSGRMGYALAEEAAKRGAAVTLITGPVFLETSKHLAEVVRVETAEQMRDAVVAHLPEQNVCVFTAAVADFTPAEPIARKIKKEDLGQETVLKLKRAPDVAAAANAARQPGQFFVGFAAETNDLESYARDKMERKGFDLVVGNLVSEANPAFGVKDNEVTIFLPSGATVDLPRTSKKELAKYIWDQIQTQLS